MTVYSKVWRVILLAVFLSASISLPIFSANAAVKTATLKGNTDYKSGLKLLKKRKHKKAIAKFSAALSSQQLKGDLPALAYYHRGVTYQSVGRFEKALADYTSTIEQNSLKDNVLKTVYYNRGLVHDTLKHADAALADFEVAIDKDPKFAAAYHNLGNVLRKKGRNAQAISYFLSSLKLRNPQPHLPYMGLALTYEALGRSSDAITSAKYALRIRPNLIKAQKMLARLTTQDLYNFPDDKNQPLDMTPKTTASISAKTIRSGVLDTRRAKLSEFEKLDLRMRGLVEKKPAPQVAVAPIRLALRGGFGTSSLGSIAVMVPGPGWKKSSVKPSYFAEVGMGRTREKAETLWFFLKVQHDDLLARYTSKIKRAKRDSGEIFYRVQAGPLKNRHAANALCEAIERRGVQCRSVHHGS